MTVSLGYIGLYEVATVFFGNSWESNPDAKEIHARHHSRYETPCRRWSDQYGYSFLYLLNTIRKSDRPFLPTRYRQVWLYSDITDKEYYTNSFHYDVRKNQQSFEHLDFEKVYPEAGASGGFIHYCEYPVLQSKNPKAFKSVGIMLMTV